MRLLSRLLVVLVICLIATAPLALPAEAQDGDGPSITLSRSSGVPGITEVTVHGRNFTPNEWVDIYYDGGLEEAVMTDPAGVFQVDLDIPESCTGYYWVLAQDEQDKWARTSFEAEPGLTVSPVEGIVGDTVTVRGHGFGDEEYDIQLLYYFDSTSSEAVVGNIEAYEDGSWERTFAIPPSSKGDHKIDAWSLDSELTDVQDTSFEVMPSMSLGELSGSAGESISITGSGFEADDRYIKIIFAAEEARTEPEIIRAGENGSWTASFEVPEMSRGTYTVTAEGALTPREDISPLSFNITPGLMLSPDEGHVGTNLTVTGGGFTPEEVVVIKYDETDLEPPTTARTNEEGGFEVSFLVPESQHGDRQVTAEVNGETEATATFAMESDPPDMPELRSPPDGSRTGVIGKVKPTFEWSEVSDDSGVYYNLQIATSANFTTTGGFADRVETISRIAGTNYTLENAEALPYGTYYWIVQAEDGAENESGWTEPRSFRAGVMPLWAFIVIVVVVAGGIGAAVYFLVIRKRIYYY